MEMPRVVDLIAVEAQDLETLSEKLTPPVSSAVGKAIDMIREWILKNATTERSEQSCQGQCPDEIMEGTEYES